MLDVKRLRRDLDGVKRALARRGASRQNLTGSSSSTLPGAPWWRKVTS